MVQITFHQPFQWDTSIDASWMVIFADGFYSNGPPTRRGEIVSASPEQWVFRGTSYAGAFDDWTVTVRRAEGYSFSGPMPYYNTPSGSIDVIEIRNPSGTLVATLNQAGVWSVDDLGWNNPLVQRDSFIGSSGNDIFNGYFGNDTLEGGAGSDHLMGDDGDDTLGGASASISLRAVTATTSSIGMKKMSWTAAPE